MYLTQTAPPDLTEWVECAWELSVPAGTAWSELTPADLHGDLVLSLGVPFAVGDSGAATASCWLGPRRAPLRFFHSAGNHLFGVRFRPGGAAAFLDVDAGALMGVQPSESGSGAWRGLLEAMASQFTASPRPEGGVVRLWDALRGVTPRRRMSDWELLSALERESPCFRVAAFAKQIGLTERTLQRRCLRSFGVGPKLLHRIQRAQAARSLVARGQQSTDIAHELGFVDQAHLCNELRALHGMTPSSPPFEPLICRLSPSSV